MSEESMLLYDLKFLASQKIIKKWESGGEDRCVFQLRFRHWEDAPWEAGYDIPYAESYEIVGFGKTVQEAVDRLMVQVVKRK